MGAGEKSESPPTIEDGGSSASLKPCDTLRHGSYRLSLDVLVDAHDTIDDHEHGRIEARGQRDAIDHDRDIAAVAIIDDKRRGPVDALDLAPGNNRIGRNTGIIEHATYCPSPQAG